MPTPQLHVKFSLQIGNQNHIVYACEGEEAISTPHQFTLRVLLPAETVLSTLLKTPATLHLELHAETQSTDKPRHARHIAGVITDIQDLGLDHRDKRQVRIILRSHLALLDQQRDSRVILGQGTPQGGVISPLLANIYLNILDKIWDKYQLAEKYKARIVRYADDLVILCKSGAEIPFTLLKIILNKLELQLNEGKTEIKDSLQ